MKIGLLIAALMILLASTGAPENYSLALADLANEKPQWTFDRLVHAIRANDRNEFLTNATDDMQQAITPKLMDKISRDLKPHLEKGFIATYLCDLKQKGCSVALWKVTFADGSDDAIFRIAMQDDQFAGFFLQ